MFLIFLTQICLLVQGCWWACLTSSTPRSSPAPALPSPYPPHQLCCHGECMWFCVVAMGTLYYSLCRLLSSCFCTIICMPMLKEHQRTALQDCLFRGNAPRYSCRFFRRWKNTKTAEGLSLWLCMGYFNFYCSEGRGKENNPDRMNECHLKQ